MIRKFLTSILILTLAVTSAYAQKGPGKGANMQQWLEEMRQVRTTFISQELGLTQEQKERFIPLYDAMSRETEKVMKETRDMERNIKRKGNAATNLELEKAAEAMYESKGRENAIEMRYFAKFKTVLTPQQLFRLKQVEHKFNMQLMDKRRQHKKKK